MTQTSTTPRIEPDPLPNVSPPPNALHTEEWQTDGSRFYRNFEGEKRSIGDSIKVWAHGVQHDDGRIDDGTRDPVFATGESVGGVFWEDAISSETARRLADFLVMAADEVDGWATR